MMLKPAETRAGENPGDAANKGFGVRKSIVHQKPGFNHEGQKQEPETGGNHAFRPSQEKDVPKGSLADRIGEAKKGE